MAKKSITTRVGDQGKTRLFSGEEVWKHSPRTDAYGDLDEIVSVLGVAFSHAERDETRRSVREVQHTLFTVGTELATGESFVGRLAERIDEAAVRAIERDMDGLEERIDMPKGFVLPGGTPAAAHLDHARTVTRRCERKVVALFEERLISNPNLLIWLNRLSDYLWLLARFEEGDRTVMK